MRHLDISIPVTPSLELPGDVSLPEQPRGLILFAHGSGSSRHSPRNRAVASGLHGAGLGTLLFDLLSEEEARNRDRVFDIPLLADRLVVATSWAHKRPELEGLPVAYFGASTGAAAALVAAAELGDEVAAVVSRGGRPDLASSHLGRVTTPTLLIVGSNDQQVLDLNEQARAELQGPAELEVVAGAGHLFEEPGALETVTQLAEGWFVRHLPSGSSS